MSPEIVPNQEITDPKPFVIRGHHLKTFMVFTRPHYWIFGPFENNPFENKWTIAKYGVGDPNAGAKEQRAYYMEAFSKRFGSIGKYSLSREKLDRIEEIRKITTESLQDIYGSTLEDADKVEDYMAQVFETFINLPDDHPAEIVEHIKDEICKGCVIGKHCETMRSSYLENLDRFTPIGWEYRYLDAFIEDMEVLVLPKPVIVFDVAYPSDGEPQMVRRLKTTVGTVKKVLNETKSGLFGYDPSIF